MHATFDPFGNADLDSLAEAFERALPKVDVTIPDELVKRFILVVQKSGIGPDLDRWEAEEQESPGGRPKPFPADTVVVGHLLAGYVHNLALDTTVRDVLYREISDDMRTLLGVRTDNAGHHGTDPDYYRRVNHRINSLLRGIDPSPWVKNRVVLKKDLDRLKKDLTPEQVVERTARLDSVVHRLLHASLMMMPRELRRKWNGAIAVDGTPIRQFTRGVKKGSKWASCDADCAWYSRAGQDPKSHGRAEATLPTANVGSGENRSADVKGRAANHKKDFWGMEATLGVMCGDDVNGISRHPNLVLAMVLDKPGFRIGENGTRVATQIARRTGQTGWLAGDRAYSNAIAEKFQLPTRALGYRHVFDYREDQLGRQANFGGAIQVEGRWYCDCMPVALIEATNAYRKKKTDKNKIDKASWQARLLARRDHLMRIHEARADGSVRLVSPCCKDKPSLTLPVQAGAKLYQDLEFGLPEHQKRYALMRNTNEGFNGTSKDGSHSGLGQATRRRKRGIAAQSLQCAVLLFAENLRRIESFQEKAAEDDQGELVFKRKGRPKRKGVEDYRPGDGGGDASETADMDPYARPDDDPPSD